MEQNTDKDKPANKNNTPAHIGVGGVYRVPQESQMRSSVNATKWSGLHLTKPARLHLGHTLLMAYFDILRACRNVEKTMSRPLPLPTQPFFKFFTRFAVSLHRRVTIFHFLNQTFTRVRQWSSTPAASLDVIVITLVFLPKHTFTFLLPMMRKISVHNLVMGRLLPGTGPARTSPVKSDRDYRCDTQDDQGNYR
jgi:hypothetical protein